MQTLQVMMHPCVFVLSVYKFVCCALYYSHTLFLGLVFIMFRLYSILFHLFYFNKSCHVWEIKKGHS